MVSEGDVIPSDQLAIILEAMKMEINVYYDGDGKAPSGKKIEVVKLVVQPGHTVKAGDAMVFVKEI